MTFVEAFETCFSKYCDFDGRATRSEYWYFKLFNFLVGFVIVSIFNMRIACGYYLAVTMPCMTVAVRRLHDIGKPGSLAVLNSSIGLINTVMILVMDEYLALLLLRTNVSFQILGAVQCVGGIILQVMACQDSQHGTNEYGPNPKGIE